MGSSTDVSYERAYIEATADRAKVATVQLLERSPFFKEVKASARKVQIHNRWEQPIFLAPPVNGKWFRRGDFLPEFSPSEPLAMANWKTSFLAVPTTMDLMEQMMRESDKTQLFDYLEMIATEASLGASRLLNAAVFQGTGGAQPMGLDTLLPKAAPTAQTGTLGGLPRAGSSSDTPYWYTQYVELTSNFGTIAAGTNIHAGILAFLELVDACTVGSAVPTHFYARRNIFRMFKRSVAESTGLLRMVSEKPGTEYIGEGETVNVSGHIIRWDTNAAADSVYSLHMGAPKHMPARVFGDGSSASMDADIEAAPNAGRWLSMEGGLWTSFHPAFNGRKLAPRSQYRRLEETSWVLHSFDLCTPRPTDLGIAGSDNNSRWSTWS